jgi:uncharacterized protein YlzI (FlbEa/FlbD family)
MAKFFTLDEGKTYYNVDHIQKITKVNPILPDTRIVFVNGDDRTFSQSTEEVLKAIRDAE